MDDNKFGRERLRAPPNLFWLPCTIRRENVATQEAKIILLRSEPPQDSDDMREKRDDDSLMLLARGGVASAFDALVRRHQARVLRVAGRYLGDSCAARDVVQSTFIALYRALPQYKPRGRFPSYLFAVLLNQCRLEVRRRSRMNAIDGDELTEPLAAGDEQILARERGRELERALGHLSMKLREVVILRFSADLSHQEISETLGIPVGTTKRRLFDALEKLRTIMGAG